MKRSSALMVAAFVLVAVLAQHGADARRPGGAASIRSRRLKQESPAPEPSPPAPAVEESADLSTVGTAIQLFQLANATVSNATVFAPTDDAFGELGIDVSNITDYFNATLGNISSNVLLTHVAPGAFNVTDLPVGSNVTLPTLSGVDIVLQRAEDGVHVLVPASNVTVNVLSSVPFGDNIVYVVDGLLLPTPPPPSEPIAPESPAGP